jgi:ATP-dependent Lhr-like helicase
MDECALPEPGARQLVEYLAAGRAALGALPTRRTWIAERFFDEAGGMQLVIHAPLGARTNRALGLALRKRFCRTFDFELQAAATDEGVLLSLGPQHSFPLETIFSFVTERTVEEVLRQAVLQAPMFGVRWRWAATRALAIPRLWKGKKLPPALARMRADDLLAAVFPAQVACQDNAPPGPIEVPDHPLVAEALRDCLTEAMDLPGLEAHLAAIARGEVRLLGVDTREPSPLAHEIVGGKVWSYLDDAPLEERRARMVAVRRALPDDAASLARLDPAAVAEVSADVWPDVRDADELHDALLELGLVPEGVGEGAGWRGGFEELVAAGRAARLRAGERTFWLAAERVGLARAAPLAGIRRLEPDLAPLASERVPARADEAVVALVRGWVPHLGPHTAASLADRLGLAEEDVAIALVAFEGEGRVLRGRFLPVNEPEPEPAPEGRLGSGAEPLDRSCFDKLSTSGHETAPDFCERTVLARIHRATLSRLRREIEPVTTADFLRFLLRWQHVAPGTQVHGERGLAEVVGQLEGFHAAAGAWERDVLAARVDGYAPGMLDALCLAGEVAWGRLSVLDSSESARAERSPREAGAESKHELRRAPTRAAPVTLALREDLPWLLAAARRDASPFALSLSKPPPARSAPDDSLPPRAREVAAALRARGASFVSELGAATRRARAEVEEGLWALVAAGRASCDGFAGLRALVNGGARGAAVGGGRWFLLAPEEPPAPDAGEPDLHERLAQLYLRRYGVVFRDLLAREDAPPWRELVRTYRRLEARGSIRGGRFVAGRSGEQFALPEAVDALRAVRRLPRSGTERVELSAADPLNLVGILTPGARVPAGLGGRVVYVDGIPSAEPVGSPVLRTGSPPPVALRLRPPSAGYAQDDRML